MSTRSRARPLSHQRPPRRPGPLPGYRRAPAPVPHHHRRPPRPRPHVTRRVIIGLLAVATIGAGIWCFVGRGSSAPGQDFASVEQRFVRAAHEVPETPRVVQHFRDLEQFDAALDARALVMQRAIVEFDAIAKEEGGRTADLARDAIATAEAALRAVSEFRAAITTSNDLVDAQEALDALDREIARMESTRREWQRL